MGLLEKVKEESDLDSVARSLIGGEDQHDKPSVGKGDMSICFC